MFQSPLAQLPSIAQFSKAILTPLSAARLASLPQTSRKRGRLSVSGLPRMRPVKPLTVSVPNRCALSMIVSQAASTSRSLSPSSSGLPNTPIELIDHVGVADRLAQLAG